MVTIHKSQLTINDNDNNNTCWEYIVIVIIIIKRKELLLERKKVTANIKGKTFVDTQNDFKYQLK